MGEPGHTDHWPAPRGGWPEFCRWCGKRLPGSHVCSFCDLLYDQDNDESL